MTNNAFSWNRTNFPTITWLIAACLILGLPVNIIAQKERARISLSYEKDGDDQETLIAKVLTKPDRSYVPVEGVPVNFYQDERNLGTATTLEDGFATLRLKKSDLELDSNLLLFSCRLEGHEIYRDADDDIQITRAKVSLSTKVVDDTVKQLTATLLMQDSLSEWVAVPQTSIRFYVKRLFGNLPIDEGFEMTGDDGSITVPFPDDIPGDEEGMLIALAEIADHDQFGTIRQSLEVNWGVPVPAVKFDRKELWSSGANAPIYMVVIVNGILLLIWGTAVYIVFLIFKINKLGKLAREE